MDGYVPEQDEIYHDMLNYVEATWRQINSLMDNDCKGWGASVISL
jgi:hypothetical protein